MKPNISAYQSIIRGALADHGWDIASVEESDAWWCHQIWRLDSLWAPCGFQTHLAFLIDPQSEPQALQQMEYKVWAVKASHRVPTQWQGSDSEPTFSLSGNWQERMPELVGHLDKMRSEESFTRSR